MTKSRSKIYDSMNCLNELKNIQCGTIIKSLNEIYMQICAGPNFLTFKNSVLIASFTSFGRLCVCVCNVHIAKRKGQSNVYQR